METVTCKACGEVLTANTEEELMELGRQHGAKHGHPQDKLNREGIAKRIRAHRSRDH